MNIVSEPLYSDKKKNNICVCSGCSENAGKRQRFCYKHARQYQKENNPLRYWLDVHKQNAKRRGKEWSITLEQFRDFCNKTSFLIFKSHSPKQYSLDRIRDWEGYHINNIQILTVPQNSRKKYVDERLARGDQPSYDEITEFYNI